MAEGGISLEDPPGEEEWWNFDPNAAIPTDLLQQTQSTTTEGNRQQATPTTVTITTSSLNTELSSLTTTTTQTITNPDNAAAFTSDFAKQLAQEEEDQRLSSVH